MGITSAYLPYENSNLRASAPTSASDRVAEPEVTEDIVHQVVFYLRALAPPAPGPMTPRREQGREFFTAIGCALCHVPEMRTGDHAVSALAHRSVHLYSDLLLHDLGEDLADDVPDGSAAGAEWRTAPLWGLRVMRDFLGGDAFLMHDGRARSVDEAIRMHGGEAAVIRARYEALSAEDRAALLDFVESR
jgi:CxxC motif-containing protein (DUF1111 family)